MCEKTPESKPKTPKSSEQLPNKDVQKLTKNTAQSVSSVREMNAHDRALRDGQVNGGSL